MLGKQFLVLLDELKVQVKEIVGCENCVWLGYIVVENGKMYFFGDSEGCIVCGLLVVLLIVVEGKIVVELQVQLLLVLFDELGLCVQFSVLCSQGLNVLSEVIIVVMKQV